MEQQLTATPRHQISRRTVAKGAAWAAPAVALTSAAPAFAVSAPCLDVPRIGRWTRSDVDVNEKPFRLINNDTTLEAIIDWAWWSGRPRPAFGYGYARTPLRVQPGMTYTINLGLQTAKGYNWPGPGTPETCETNNTTLEVAWIPAGGERQILLRGATQETAGHKLFEPTVNCSGPVTNRPAVWRSFPNENITFHVPCGSVTTGQLELKFTAYPHARVTKAGNASNFSKTQFSNQNNDDWRVTPRIVSCVRTQSC
ncbi:hypothetical protein [Tessaracoccus massiliensis]|uniref:hypothetical protein n=1 Tax=Tessaracoccus massiliensis TaxID=1522311 RepID=UPI00058E78D8|nr:hypothetical protein [Tessaracoccus massiliensis]